MARTVAADIRQIYSDTMKDDQHIDAAITVASLLTDLVAADAASPGAAHLKEIERWLAAHFLAIHDPVSLREVMGDGESWNFPASVTTAWSRGLGLTPYGQQAVALDFTGVLANLGRRKANWNAAPRENSVNYTRHLTDPS